MIRSEYYKDHNIKICAVDGAIHWLIYRKSYGIYAESRNLTFFDFMRTNLVYEDAKRHIDRLLGRKFLYN